MKTKNTTVRSGFTLLEMMIASSLSVVLLSALISTYIACGRMMESQRIRSEVSSNAQLALIYLKRDIEMAGYGVSSQGSDLRHWISWVSGVTNPLIIRNGGTTGVLIRITAAFDRIGSIQADVNPGASTISVTPAVASLVSSNNRQVLYLGRSELVRVTGVSGNTLTISTKPSSNQGVSYSYETQAPVELVKVITYSLDHYGAGSSLLRHDEAEPLSGNYFAGYRLQTLLDGIDRIVISRSNRIVSIALTAKSKMPDRLYRGTNAPYRTVTLGGEVYLKNSF